MNDYTQIRVGMDVRSADGEDLGTVSSVAEDSFHIEKGLFFPKDYSVSLSEVGDVDEDEVTLTTTRDQLASGTSRASEGTTTRTDALSATHQGEGELRVPVMEEQLEVGKHSVEAGAVHLKKEVVTEMKTVTVPVSREVVSVERVAVDPNRPVDANTATFDEQEISIPLRAEQVDISKRAVVTEEVRIKKGAVTEQQQVAENVRRENVTVAEEGEVKRLTNQSSDLSDPEKR